MDTEKTEDLLEKIENLETHLAAVYYYLYRYCGHPFGNNGAGFTAWIEAQFHHPFDLFSTEAFRNVVKENDESTN